MKDFTENFIFALFNVNNNSIHSESKLTIKNNRLVWGFTNKKFDAQLPSYKECHPINKSD